jgi:antitoxin component YwqK of YwqJK toxin-antitoxin module
MRLLVTVTFFLAFYLCFGQETKFVSKDGGGFTEEYYVLKNDKNVRHGTYVKYRQPFGQIVIIESGSYTNGEKNGLWEEFYNEFSKKTWNAIKEKGNYVNGKRNGIWTYYHLDTATNITNVGKIGQNKEAQSVNVNIDQKDARLRLAGIFLNDKRVGEWTSWDIHGVLIQKYNFSTGRIIFDGSIKDTVLWNTNRKPIFVGGPQSLSYHLATNIKPTQIANKMKRDSIGAMITFNIDKYGKTNNITVPMNSGDQALEDELIRLISTTDSFWIPAIKEGVKFEYTFKLRYHIILIESTPNSRQLRSYFSVIE